MKMYYFDSNSRKSCFFLYFCVCNYDVCIVNDMKANIFGLIEIYFYFFKDK